MKKPKQLQLFKADLRFFGGRLLHGRRRSARPLSSKEPIHLILRSSWAKGSHSFLQPRNKNEISRLIRVISAKYFVRIYKVAIVGNHLHLIMLSQRRQNYKTFIRVLSSQIASHVMRKQSFKVFRRFVLSQNWGDPHPGLSEQQGLGQQFWQFRPFTRVLRWGRDFKNSCSYVRQNTLEALGFVEYKPRQDRYAKWSQKTMPFQKME
jgi:REP element-mobilizing transposase RayT